MKKIFLLTLLMAVSGSFAQANPVVWGGENCALTDSKDDSWLEVGKSLNLAKYSEAQIKNLPTVTKQQVIIMAKYYAKNENVQIKNTIEAVNYLKTADGPYISNYVINDELYTELLTYPGDNAVGLIFKYKTTQLIAENSDDSLICLNK